MAKAKLNILEHPKKLLLIVALGLAAAVFLHSPKAAAAACSAPATNMGTVTSTTNVATAGTYRIWTRIMSGTAATDNSYDLEIDGANCYHVGNNNSMAAGSWQWVDYQNGSTSTKINLALGAGSHTIKMIGTEDGVKLDRIIMTTDTACVPTGTGDNCVPAVDSTNPTTSITSPAANARIKGTINVTANASDNSGTVSKVELYLDGGSTPIATDTSSPYSLSWNSALTTNGTHTLTVKAYDPSGNVATSAGVTVSVDNSVPVVDLTAPANGARVSDTIDLKATASDNVGVTSVDFYQGLTLLSSDTTSPYSYSWDTTTVDNGDYTITASARDAAGNTTNESVSITVNNPTQPPIDTVNPTTSITSPTGGPVNGTVNVTASASDNVGVTKVVLYVDDAIAGTDVASPYSFSWNTLGLTNGPHQIKARAYDAAGNNQYSTVVTVTVNNPSSNPGDVNGDGHVTIIDLSTLLTNYGGSGKARAQGDLTGDGSVNILDLSKLLSNYGS